MNKFIVVFVLVFCFGCGVSKNEKDYVISSCNQKVVYFRPSVEGIDRLRDSFSSEDDFYVVADDNAFYFSLAHRYLTDNKIDYDIISMDSNSYILVENRRFLLPKDMAFGGFFIYEKDKYNDFVSCIDINSKWVYINGTWNKIINYQIP